MHHCRAFIFLKVRKFEKSLESSEFNLTAYMDRRESTQGISGHTKLYKNCFNMKSIYLCPPFLCYIIFYTVYLFCNLQLIDSVSSLNVYLYLFLDLWAYLR